MTLEKEVKDKSAKTRYFQRLSLRTKKALVIHKYQGRLWDKEDSWKNVSEHCLVEAARSEVFADLLGLPEDIKSDLRLAATGHDFNKRNDMEKANLGMNELSKSGSQAETDMRNVGFSERVIIWIRGLEDNRLLAVEGIASKPAPSSDEIAYMVMHYLDDYTINSNWTTSVELVSDGRRINDLDRRIDKLEANPKYTDLNEEGRTIFNGETAFQAQRRVGHLIETKLAELINKKQGTTIDPLNLPEFVDERLKQRILNMQWKDL